VDRLRGTGVIGLLACVPEDPPARVDTGTIGGWYDAEANDLTPTWTAEEAIAEWQALLDAPIPGCNEVIAAWLVYFEMGEGSDCLGSDPGYLHDDVGCTIDNGIWLRGQTDYRYEEDVESGTMEHVVNLDLDVVWPKGDEAALQGSCGTSGGLERPGTRFEHLEGTYRDPTQPELLGDGLEAFWDGGMSDLEDGTYIVTAEGGIGWDGTHFLFFDDFTVSNEGCASGVAQVRDPSSGWWTVTYGEGCDPEAPLLFAGQDQGMASLDWSGWIANRSEKLWTQVPWEGAL
jgi:hypothetical protein